MNQTINYNIHGIVGIRLINASHDDADAVSDQLGLLPGRLCNTPDIIIRYEEKLPSGRLNLVGRNHVAFDDEGFYLLDSTDSRPNVRLPFDKVGECCEIQCKTGIGAVPLLNFIVNLTLIKKNYIPVHGSAFQYCGRGILVMGWAVGGKTATLLSFAKNGARYVGDEWVVLSADGTQMFGIPTPSAIKEWQFPYIPDLLPKISLQEKMVFGTIHMLDKIFQIFSKGRLAHSFPVKVLGRALPKLRKQLRIRVNPRTFFKERFCETPVRLDKVLFIMTRKEEEILVEPYKADRIAQRMIHSNDAEYDLFYDYYRIYKFAFPDRENRLLENLFETQRSLLLQALSNKEAYRVLRPYPVSLDRLYEEIRPFCTATLQPHELAVCF